MSHPFEQHLQQHGILPTTVPPTPTAALNGSPTADCSAYAQAALRNESDNVALAPEGTRNHTLNVAAFNLTSLVDAGALDRDEVNNTLTAAARQAGLNDTEIRNTIASGTRGSATKIGARHIPEPPTNITEVNSAELTTKTTDPEQRDLHEIRVTRQAYELRVMDEARALWGRLRAGLMGQQPPAMIPMPDFLAIPDEPARYRVDQLLPIGGRALLAAQYKAGKTSMIANLLRCLADGDLFLGRYHTYPVSRILLIDTELDERMLRRWLRDQNIRNATAVNVLCLRGRLTAFGITDDRTRAQWAAIINGADYIILDCLRPCLDALGLSEDKEAGIFLTAFDALCKECGADEATVVHHMGHSQERSRGDSRLLDWPDVLWRIIRDDTDTDNIGDRFFSAEGRDVYIPESQLDWCPETRALTICGGSRIDKKAHNAEIEIIELMSLPENADGLSQSQLVNKLKPYGLGRNVARLAIAEAVRNTVLVTTPGPKRTTIHVLNPSRRTP